MKHEINETDLRRMVSSEMILVLVIDALKDNDQAVVAINNVVSWAENEGADRIDEALQVLMNRQESRVDRVVH